MSRCVALLLLIVLALPSQAQEGRTVSALNVSIAAFDPGVPEDLSMHRDLQVFPRIREIEAKFLPFVLRQTLVESGNWGAVRVVPEPEPAAEILVSGTILKSDGDTLDLRVSAIDASGRVWFDKVFAGEVTDSYAKRNTEVGLAGYRQLYDAIAYELLAAREQLTNDDLTNIVRISLLRYATELAPSTFNQYLDKQADGTYTVLRLPAVDDPMVDRIERIRSTEYVITDTVDAKFRELHSEIARTYDLWRGYRRKYVDYQAEDARYAESNRYEADRGSYEALRNQYDNYKWNRIGAQEQDSWAVAFNNEVGPTIDAMEDRIEELEEWVDLKYAEWHHLLEELFVVETGQWEPS